jgi:carbonic anhydrase
MKIPKVNAIYDVLQYHIHAGSDHTLDGNHFGADMHIVHRNRSGTNLAVLGLFIEPTNNMNSDVFGVLIQGLQDVSKKTKVTCANRTKMTRYNRRRLGSTKYRDLATKIYNPYI